MIERKYTTKRMDIYDTNTFYQGLHKLCTKIDI